MRQLVLATAAMVALLLVAGCGSARYTYVKNSGEHTYFKVPTNWNKVDQAALDKLFLGTNPDSATAQVRKKQVWTVAFDASTSPDAVHVFESQGDAPFVFVSVAQLSTTQRDGMSLDGLRNLIFPVSTSARQTATANSYPLTNFELLDDTVLSPGHGIRGVHAVFNYEFPDGSLETFDQTAYVSDDASRIYLMLVTCSARCHRDKSGELSTVSGSFTVRSR
jgi:hypothetical protein